VVFEVVDHVVKGFTLGIFGSFLWMSYGSSPEGIIKHNKTTRLEEIK